MTHSACVQAVAELCEGRPLAAGCQEGQRGGAQRDAGGRGAAREGGAVSLCSHLRLMLSTFLGCNSTCERSRVHFLAVQVAELKGQLAAIRSTLADATRRARQPGSPALSSGSRSRSRPQQGSSGPGEQEGTKGPAAAAGGGGGEEDEVLYDEELLSYISDTDYLEETQQRRREAAAAVLESDAVLREELAEVLRQKVRG